jgi:hypothetical protein
MITGFTAHRLQRITLTQRHLSPVRRTPVQQTRLEWGTRPVAAPIQAAPVARRLPWGSLSSLLLIAAIIAVAFAVTGVRL